MSFDPRFDKRWTDVIAPGITDALTPQSALVPHRIDLSRRGDSILAEILDEISRCRLIVADITTIGSVNGSPVRNSNVLYELGLAHSARMPEEVIVLRSDSDFLPFDVANVRVHSYSPDTESAAARDVVRRLVREAQDTIDLTRSRTVARVAEVLDFECWDALYDIASTGPIGHPGRADVVAQLTGILQAVSRIGGIQRLLEFGAIESSLRESRPSTSVGIRSYPGRISFGMT